MEEVMKSVGIDIGTSTTQMIISEITLKDIAGFGRVPETKIVGKRILYRGQIHFTPLLDVDHIDAKRVWEIVEGEYRKSGISPETLDTGAIIITGETMRKQNARDTLELISQKAGNFVVATAGPDLESVLAGRGSGAAALSEKTGKLVANLDIGGGTTNIAYFRDGDVYDTACLDIGGRLVKIREGRYTYISEKVQEVTDLREGQAVDEEKLRKLAEDFAELLAQAVGLTPATKLLEHYQTNHLITVPEVPDIFVFSGGVAACMEERQEPFAFGDLGVILAEEIVKNPHFQRAKQEKAAETMRATVIGAGNETMDISGSTISYTETDFPQKSIPIGKIRCSHGEDLPHIEEEIRRVKRYFAHRGNIQLAIAFDGLAYPTFSQVQEMAEALVKSYDELFDENQKMILILKEDMAKALGQAIQRLDASKRTLICMDGIRCTNGDYIDIGKPVAGGSAIPVVIKTLIFQNHAKGE